MRTDLKINVRYKEGWKSPHLFLNYKISYGKEKLSRGGWYIRKRNNYENEFGTNQTTLNKAWCIHNKNKHSLLQSQHFGKCLINQSDRHLQSPFLTFGCRAHRWKAGKNTINIIWKESLCAQREMLVRMSKLSLNLHFNDFQGSWGGACRNPEWGSLCKRTHTRIQFHFNCRTLKKLPNLIPTLTSKLYTMCLFKKHNQNTDNSIITYVCHIYWCIDFAHLRPKTLMLNI